MKKHYEIIVPLKRYKQLIFVFGIGAIALTGIILFLFFKIIIGEIEFKPEIISTVISFLIFFNYAMWLIFGYEKLIITNEFLEILKSNRIFSITKKYRLTDIKHVSIKEKLFKSNRFIDTQRERIREKQRAFLWYRMGRIELQFKHRSKTILNGIDDNKAKQLLKMINEAIIYSKGKR